MRLADLDGERLLTWRAPETPYTDLLVTRVRAAGAEVEPVGEHNVGIAVEDEISLPLLLWPAGMPSAAVQRLRAGMGTSG